MLYNYLKVAVRILLKQKIYAAINILGLTLGITCCLLISLFVQHELSYDRFHEKGDRIFRLVRLALMNGELGQVALTSGPYASALLTDFPGDVKAAVRVFPASTLVTYQNKSFKEDRFLLADSNFFQFFTFPLVAGNPRTALAEPYTLVLTKATARKYFGAKNPIGQLLTLDKTKSYRVTGVMDNLPANSHLTFDLIASLQPMQKEEWFSNWKSNGMYTYVLLPNADNRLALEGKFPAFMEKHMGDLFRKWGVKMDLKLQPLADIYLKNRSIQDQVEHGSRSNVYIFSAIAVFILVIACINFMNLTSARGIDRAKEVGVRKVLGAYKQNLVLQFMGESTLLATIAVLLSILLISYALPFFNALADKNLEIPFASPLFYVFLVGITLLVGFGAGSYPAIFLSSFRPIRVLKGQFSSRARNPVMRQALVVFQFTISIALIIGTGIIFKQMQYVQHKNLGFEKDLVITIPLDNADVVGKRRFFTQQVQQLAGVKEVSVMSGEPGGYHNRYVLEVADKPAETWSFRTVFTDMNYLPALNIKLVAGRNYSKDYLTDSAAALILNETAVKHLGWTPQEALGKKFTDKGFGMGVVHHRRVVGVVKDYHFCSLKENIEPLAILIHPDYRVAAIRLKPGNSQATIAGIKQIYAEVAPKYPFVYNFLDDSFNRLYMAEQRQAQITTIFSGLAIFIACLGLFGLASYSTEQRRKEIGIRKILGASVGGILSLLSKDFLKLVVLANFLAWPLAWFIMQKWLENFRYPVEMGLTIFVLAGFLALLIAVLTISFQAVKVAVTNPVMSLRDE